MHDRDRHGGGVALFISDKLADQVTMSGPDGLFACVLYMVSTIITIRYS